MSEEYLKQLPLIELLELMVLKIDEILAMQKIDENPIEIQRNKKFIQLLQRVIDAKKAESLSHSNIPY